MAKRKTKEPIVIDKTPLKATSLGNLETKENGPLVAILWVGLLVVCIISLPYIADFVQNYQNNKIIDTPTKKPDHTSDNNTQGEITKDQAIYNFEKNLVITENKFNLSDFSVSNNVLTFKITNVGGDVDYFKKHNYFVELFNDDKTLLQRIKFDGITINKSKTITLNVDAVSFTKISFIEKDVKDYPNVTLKKVSEIPTLTCQNKDLKVIYTFSTDEDNKLKTIETNYSYASTNKDYEQMLSRYETYATSYNSLGGVKATLIPINTGFTFKVNIDLATIPEASYTSTFTDKYYYSLDTEAKIVAFELKTSGFTCN